jgi:hypothetical protein
MSHTHARTHTQKILMMLMVLIPEFCMVWPLMSWKVPILRNLYHDQFLVTWNMHIWFILDDQGLPYLRWILCIIWGAYETYFVTWFDVKLKIVTNDRFLWALYIWLMSLLKFVAFLVISTLMFLVSLNWENHWQIIVLVGGSFMHVLSAVHMWSYGCGGHIMPLSLQRVSHAQTKTCWTFHNKLYEYVTKTEQEIKS